MATAYPGAVDNFPRPGPTTNTDDPGFELDVILDSHSDAIEGLEKKNRGWGWVGASLPNSFYGQNFPTHSGLDATQTRGTARAVPAGVPLSGIMFYVNVATAIGATVSVGVYECDEIGHPTTRVNLTSGIAATSGWKTVTFSHTPIGGLLWVFFKPSVSDSFSINGFNNNSPDYYGVPRSSANYEAQRSCYITGNSLPADATGTLNVDTNWSYQPGWVPYYNAVRPV